MHKNSRQRGKFARLSTTESETFFDILIRVEKLFAKMHRESGLRIDPNAAARYQKSFRKLLVHNMDFLERMAMDLGIEEVYNESDYMGIIREFVLKDESDR